VTLNVVITDYPAPPADVEAQVFAESGLDIHLSWCDGTREDLGRQLGSADAAMVGYATIDRSLIETMNQCRIISRFGVGTDMVDLQAAGDHGIPVTNVPDYCIDEVSTHTIGLIIALSRHIVELNAYAHAGGWGRDPLPAPMPFRTEGQILGIIGLGRIGRAVAAKGLGLALRVVSFDPYARDETFAECGIGRMGLTELLKSADYVSLHCPLTAETRGLIGSEELRLMKPTAYLINMARGPVVVQEALREALQERRIAGAALDVLDVEPPPADEPMLQLDNVILTPHTAATSVEAILQLRRQAAVNVVLALKGQPLTSVVNRDLL
jgi:D-3-phosphoglycerate dehydrogenase